MPDADARAGITAAVAALVAALIARVDGLFSLHTPATRHAATAALHATVTDHAPFVGAAIAAHVEASYGAARPALPTPLHAFGSTQLDLPPALAALVADLSAAMPDADLAPDGREDHAHVTVQFGLPALAQEDLMALRDVAAMTAPIALVCGETAYFPAEESGVGADVVYVTVHAPAIVALRDAIRAAIPGIEETRTTYTPHVTLAYVHAGRGVAYAGQHALDGATATVTYLLLTDQYEHSTQLPFGGEPADEAQ